MTKDEALTVAYEALTKGTYEQKLAAAAAVRSVLKGGTNNRHRFIGWAVFDGKGRFGKFRTNKVSADKCLALYDMKFADVFGPGKVKPVYIPVEG